MVYFNSFQTTLFSPNFSEKKKMKILELSFREFTKELKFDNDWFTPNIPTWLTAFQKNQFDEKTELNCLEIEVGKGCQQCLY